MANEYVNGPRITYGSPENPEGMAQFVRVCEVCGRFVKADPKITMNASGLSEGPNATCARCGPTRMLFEGFF